MYLFSGDGYSKVIMEAYKSVLLNGISSTPRSMETLELQDVHLVIRNPFNRLPMFKKRNANVFALLAETIWLLAGRNDLSFMSFYLPRLPNYSDDKVTVTGAYGPRIRNWNNVDQLRSVYNTLNRDPYSRRAVISLFDPTCDHVFERLDVPCNNWIQFSRLDGRLNMRVTSRSMDALWGSTINVFEWTTLQELLAYWLGLSLGEYNHYIGSFHIYGDRLKDIERMIDANVGMDYSKHADSVSVDISYDTLDSDLALFFEIESNARGRNDYPDINVLRSKWMQYATRMLLIYIEWKGDNDTELAVSKLSTLPVSDLKEAGLEFMQRKRNSL